MEEKEIEKKYKNKKGTRGRVKKVDTQSRK